MNYQHVQTYFKLAAFGGLTYLLGRFMIFKAGAELSEAPDWLFRIVIIVTISLAIIMVKRSNGQLLTIREGLSSGIFTSGLLALFIAIGTWFHCDIINPQYTDEYKEAYRDLHYTRMMQKYIHNKWGKDTITQGAIDTVNSGLDKNINQYTATMFTTKGQVSLNLLYALFWGLAVTFTVSILNRRVKDE